MIYTFLRAPIKKAIWLLALSLIVMSLFMSLPYIWQVEAQDAEAELTNVYSDYGLDLDGNGLFDYLVFTIEVDVITKENYTVGIENLQDSSSASISVKNDKTLELDVGVQNVSLYIPGLSLFSSGRDGRYTISYVYIKNYTEGDYKNAIVLDYENTPYTTINAYSHGDFEEGVYADDLATAMDVNPSDLIDATFSIDRIAGAVITGNVGFLFPTEGGTFVMLSTGNAQPSDFDPYRGWIGTPNDFLSNDNENPDGTGPSGEVARDIATLNLTLLVPEGANSLRFDFIFMSEEYPEWVGKGYNDFFSCLLDGRNIANDTEGNIINVDNNFFDDSRTPEGTVFDGTTVLLTSKAPVTEGATIKLDFIVGDANDTWYDTAVFLDNFNFSTEEIDEPVTAPTMWTSDSSGNKKNTFAPTDAVYVAVPATGKDVAFYIVTDKDVWNDDDPLIDVSDGVEELTLNPGPGIQVVPVWVSSLTLGNYDVVEDTNKNGLYDAGADGIDSVAEVGFTIEYVPPVASFTYSPESSVIPGEVITFNASGSYDPNGSIVSYDWDFGEPGATGSGEIVTYSYADDGVYTVTLTVTDDDSETAVTSVDITVSSGPVHNLDIGLDYSTIQAAIDAPETLAGHTIFVDSGVYYETVNVYKSISLIGENSSNTIIDGNGALSVLAIYADGVSVIGFTVMHSYGEPGDGGGGLVVGGFGNIQISDIIARNNDADWGVHLTPGSHDVNITSTVIVNNSRGGLLLNANQRVTVGDNLITNNNGGGISLYGASSNTVSGNTIAENNGIGIYLSESSNNNFLFGNNIINNAYGVQIGNCSGNIFYHNNFIGNTVQANVTSGYTNVWDDGYPSGGNFWSNYAGADADRDGIGDTPYIIDENNKDNYPLMGDLEPPVASFTYSPGSPVHTGEFISFDATSSYDPNGSIVSYEWDFGDGSTDSGVTVTHPYVDDGTYIVTLTVTDNDGVTDSKTITIEIVDVTKPVANAGSDRTVVEDTTVSFNAGASSDNVGIVSYEWDFGDGTTGTGLTVTHTYTQPGTYSVLLTVRDAAGNSNTDTITVTVKKRNGGGGDAVVKDSDNDGINDDQDAFPFDPTETVDTDVDGIGNNADPDDDNDGVPDAQDIFPLDPSESLDTDGDGLGNNADADDDNDGVLDDDDAFPLNSLESTDTDGDGIGNNEDTDDDGDGMPDRWEIDNGLNPLDAQDASFDSDNDRLTSFQEYQLGTNPNVYDAETTQLRTLSVLAVVVGAFTAVTAAILANLVGLATSFDAAISKLSIPDELQEFLQLYGEKLFETVDKAKLEALRRAPFITKGESVALMFSALIGTFVFGLAEAGGVVEGLAEEGGLVNFLTSGLVNFIPVALVIVCVVIILAEVFEACCARICRVHKRFSLWMYGSIMFLISGLLFGFPIGSPGITRYKSGDLSDKVKGLFVLSKMLLFMMLMIPFAGLSMLGFDIVGEFGLWFTLTTVFSSLIPVRPLVGKALYDYRKDVSLAALAFSGLLFFSVVYSRAVEVVILPPIVYFGVGAVSAFLAAITLQQLRKAYPT